MKNSLRSIALFSMMAFAAMSCKEDVVAEEERGTGLELNSETELEKVPESDFDESIFQLPAAFSLNGPAIKNQGSTNKCVSFSGAYYIIGLYNGVANGADNLDKVGSPEFSHNIYKKTLGTDNCTNGSYLFNEGNIKGLAEIYKTVGVCSWNQLPFENTKACTIIPTAANTQAAVNKISDYTRLDKNEYANIAALKSWLYGGHPLWFAVPVDKTDFANLDANTVWTKSTGASNGSHAMVIVGWDDAKKAFRFANSWGTGWGDKGYSWIGYDHYINLINKTKMIGVLYPNAAQRPFFNQLTPASCGNAGWGELVVDNKRTEEIAIEITGTNYNNTTANNVDASEFQSYSGVAKGAVKVKVYNKTKTTLIKEFPVTVIQCDKVVLTVN